MVERTDGPTFGVLYTADSVQDKRPSDVSRRVNADIFHIGHMTCIFHGELMPDIPHASDFNQKRSIGHSTYVAWMSHRVS